MIIRNVTGRDLDRALDLTNQKYDDNIQFNRVERMSASRGNHGSTWRVTLRVKSSTEPGHRMSPYHPWTGKQHRMVAACWHVHGTFFNNLPAGAVINTGLSGRTVPGAEWHDPQVGSKMNPAYLSELCECA